MHVYVCTILTKLLCCMCISASGRTNTSLRGMDYGLTTAVFCSKTQTAIANKNADLRRQGNATPTDSSGRRVTVATKQSTTATPRGKSLRETTPTRTGGLSSAAVRSEPLRHTLVRQASPKTKVAGAGKGRSKTPSRALSPTGEGGRNGGRAGKTPTSGV